ncbi:MAG: hypothetical protein JSV73_01240 [Flavobacteriaceae bacterium]|nr:MAG: hypothetical protein JSV73_01240 [Flavobacteriaceae bacterium]
MKNPINLKLTVSVMFLALLTFCADDDPIQYQLKTSCIPEETGTVTPLPGMYNEGSEIELKATPIDEYIFKNWTGDASGNANPLKIIMLEDKNITAVFEKVQYTLDIIINGGGTVKQEVLQSKTTTFPSGTHLKLIATPFPGWQFVFWDGDVEGVENPMEITMTKSMTITVYFEPTKQTYVPDDNFEKALVDLGLDRLMDDYVFDLYVADVDELDLSGLGIKDLTGIEAFTNLKELNCSNNELSTLDLTKNIRLESLNCSNNELSTLDLTKNIRLESLNCSNNSLEDIDLTNNKNLYVLILSNNELTRLDISHLTEWINLWADNNNLKCIQAYEDQWTNALNDCTPPPYLPPSPYDTCMVVDEGVTFSLDCDN